MIADDLAERFAQALISNAGNRTRAAIQCGYLAGGAARAAGCDLARNPKVLKHLQPLAAAQLSALTPAAIQTLAGLLTNKSGYIRLEAAKDILNRNGVGASNEPVRAQPLVVRINLAAAAVLQQPTPMLIATKDLPISPLDEPGGRKTGATEVARTPAHDFSLESDLGIDAKVPEAASRVLDLDLDDSVLAGTPLDNNRGKE